VNHRLSIETFLRRSKFFHGERYDYSLVNYICCSDKVIIICPLHGQFSQIAYSHMRGQGCPKCRYLRNGCNRIKSFEKFTTDARKIHGDVYDYSLVKYVNAKKKVDIICKKHGIFRQAPAWHINLKHGCPKCNSSRGEIAIRQWLETNNVLFKEQQTFSDCRNPKTNYPFKFDFYILGKKILIEYDGEQHFRPMYLGKNHKTIKDLQETKWRDGIKNEYAKQRGIKLVRIPYFEFERIPEILKENIYES